jgi:hypothetical protein
MADADKPDKRKRPAPEAPEYQYVVTWNPKRRSWDVHPDGTATGTFAYDKNTPSVWRFARATRIMRTEELMLMPPFVIPALIVAVFAIFVIAMARPFAGGGISRLTETIGRRRIS